MSTLNFGNLNSANLNLGILAHVDDGNTQTDSLALERKRGITIDRRGARYASLLDEIAEKLTPAILPMGRVRGLGGRGAVYAPFAGDTEFRTRLVDLLADHDDALLKAYVDDESDVSHARLLGALAEQSRSAAVHPVLFGSAITGAGVDALMAGVRNLLPAADGDRDGPPSGTVFKVERGPAG